jgi:hypothetical protein
MLVMLGNVVVRYDRLDAESPSASATVEKTPMAPDGTITAICVSYGPTVQLFVPAE